MPWIFVLTGDWCFWFFGFRVRCGEAVSHGQNTFVSLMVLAITVALWRARQAFIAGLVCGLLFYKPQLGAIVAVVMVASLGRRALLGVAITGTFLLLVTVATMPGAL